MRMILTVKDLKKPITIENENDERTTATAEQVLFFLTEVAKGVATFKEIVITEEKITIRTKF